MRRKPANCHDNDEPSERHELNVFKKECLIVSALPRGKRVNDGAVYPVTKLWKGRSKHFSEKFEVMVLA